VELKDVVLSTLSEISNDVEKIAKSKTPRVESKDLKPNTKDMDMSWIQEECQFLENLRERLLVLFEGFQSPNNKSVESKIDLTLNFLEYLLALLDERIAKLKKL